MTAHLTSFSISVTIKKQSTPESPVEVMAVNKRMLLDTGFLADGTPDPSAADIMLSASLAEELGIDIIGLESAEIGSAAGTTEVHTFTLPLEIRLGGMDKNLLMQNILIDKELTFDGS